MNNLVDAPLSLKLATNAFTEGTEAHEQNPEAVNELLVQPSVFCVHIIIGPEPLLEQSGAK